MTPSLPQTALYTDLSRYYDLMCADIDYREQSEFVRRVHGLLGNQGVDYLDLACGTGPHIAHFMEFGYRAQGMDIHQPMLDIAQQRCPGAQFFCGDMASFAVAQPLDLISCFLYSIHYNADLEKLERCFAQAHKALNAGGMFCFNAVDKDRIDNRPGIKRHLQKDASDFCFQSNWFYPGTGAQQQLQLCIEKTTQGITETWRDHHPMVALSFAEMHALLSGYFEVYCFEHDYRSLLPWNGSSGNAIFVCIKQTTAN